MSRAMSSNSSALARGSKPRSTRRVVRGVDLRQLARLGLEELLLDGVVPADRLEDADAAAAPRRCAPRARRRSPCSCATGPPAGSGGIDGGGIRQVGRVSDGGGGALAQQRRRASGWCRRPGPGASGSGGTSRRAGGASAPFRPSLASFRRSLPAFRRDPSSLLSSGHLAPGIVQESLRANRLHDGPAIIEVGHA